MDKNGTTLCTLQTSYSALFSGRILFLWVENIFAAGWECCNKYCRIVITIIDVNESISIVWCIVSVHLNICFDWALAVRNIPLPHFSRPFSLFRAQWILNWTYSSVVPMFILALVFLSNTHEHDTSANNVVTKTVEHLWTSRASERSVKENKMNPFTVLWSDTQANVFITSHIEWKRWWNDTKWKKKKFELSFTVNMHSYSFDMKINKNERERCTECEKQREKLRKFVWFYGCLETNPMWFRKMLLFIIKYLLSFALSLSASLPFAIRLFCWINMCELCA